MVSSKNVECRRCGRQWYSEEFFEDGEVPELCPYCYRDSVREIPDPPTKIDKWEEKMRQKKQEIPVILKQKKHQLVLWKENNKLLLSMVAMGLIMIIMVSIMTYFLFLM